MQKVAFWNTADLFPPPENVCQVQISLNNAISLQKIFQNASSIFKVLNILDLEAALLSRIIWKSKSRFRGDKMLHRLEAVNRGLLKYLALDITKVYKTFGKKLPNLQKRNVLSETVLPSRQMLEWVLVRTQGFARLFCYLAHNCEEAAKVWIDPLKRGLLWTISPIVIGILSRIWAIVKYLIVNACNWYTELLPYRPTLKSVGLRWLPSDYVLPEDFLLWLNMPHITDVVEKQEVSKLGSSLMHFLEMSDEEGSAGKVVNRDISKQMSLMDFLERSDKEEERMLPSTYLASNMRDSNKPTTALGMNRGVDIGEFVSREIEEEPAEVNDVPKKKKMKLKNKNMAVDIGEYVSRGIEETPAQVNDVPRKKKLKNKNMVADRELNAKPGSVGQSTVTSTNKKKKKSKNTLAKEGPQASVAEKLNNANLSVTTIKKKANKIHKMNELPKTDGSMILTKKKTKAERLAIKEKKQMKTKKVNTS